GAVQTRAACRLTAAEDARELAVAEPADELEQDDLALAGLERGERLADQQPPLGELVVVVDDRRVVDALRVKDSESTPAAQLVDRRVARDREKPRAGAAAAQVKEGAAPVGALK